MSPATELATLLQSASPELREVLGRLASDARTYQDGMEGPVAGAVIDLLIPLGNRARRELESERVLQFRDGLGKRRPVTAYTGPRNPGDQESAWGHR